MISSLGKAIKAAIHKKEDAAGDSRPLVNLQKYAVSSAATAAAADQRRCRRVEYSDATTTTTIQLRQWQ
jgi:hypothetical protein